MDEPLDGTGFNEREFFEEQFSADWRWLLPLSLAIAIHIAVFAGALYLPGIIRHRPLLDEVVTVDLVSLPEPARTPPPSPPVQKAEPVAREKVARPVIPPEPPAVAEAPVPEVTPEPAAPARPISVRPLKRKIRKARDTRLAEEKERERLARQARERQRRERARQKALARARAEERKAEEARRRAVAELAALIRTSDAAAPKSRRNSGGRQVRSIVFKQYLSALYDRVHSYWVLPEMRQWDPGLEAVVVLTIGRDGSVLRTTMEKRSQDPFFDQFVMKTIQNASPMPRFSKLMPDKTIEVGLRFRPGELSM